jgi:putative ATPase
MIGACMLPLAELLRPKTLSEVVGHAHLVAPGAPLAQLVAQNKLPSLILWGPPGSGKTTLANILLTAIDCYAVRLSAVFSGVKEIKEALAAAEENAKGMFAKPTVIFVDEIHRFNKAQQDAFLHHLEAGSIILIGATTENPSFEINNALLSRLQVYVLESLGREDLLQLVARAVATQPGRSLSTDGLDLLLALSDGDARRLINLLELLFTALSDPEITASHIRQVVPHNLHRFDKGGEEFYNQISALHKSIRGSDPDAALYWFGRMLHGGADALYLARRLLRMAWEDIGLADTNAATVVNNALLTYERLGSPEGELALAGAVVYLAVTNKSNSLELAYNQLRTTIANSPSSPVPLHLRNAPTKLMAELGYGREYKYAHDFPEHYVPNEHYFPDGMPAYQFYTPTEQGFERRIGERLNYLRKLDQAAQEAKEE